MSRIFVIHSGSYSDQSVDLVRVPDEMAHAYRSLFRDATCYAEFDEGAALLRATPVDWSRFWPDDEPLSLAGRSPLHARIIVCVLAYADHYRTRSFLEGATDEELEAAIAGNRAP